jgi:hypothetical protein
MLRLQEDALIELPATRGLPSKHYWLLYIKSNHVVLRRKWYTNKETLRSYC